MKIAFSLEWIDATANYGEPCELLRIVDSTSPLGVAWVSGSKLFIWRPVQREMTCTSTADGKVKVEEYLREKGVLIDAVHEAAPELLKALKALDDSCQYWNDQDDPELQAARKAIAKAEGEL